MCVWFLGWLKLGILKDLARVCFNPCGDYTCILKIMFPFAAVIKHCWGIGSCKLLGCNQAHVYAIHQDSWDISRAVTEKLTHWSLKKLLPFWYFKCIFYNIYCNLIQILLKFVFLRVQFTISKHWLKFWLGTEQEKKSPDPIITQIYDPIWHRLATMRNSASPDDILDCEFFFIKY